jgi:serine/threonine protein kinase
MCESKENLPDMEDLNVLAARQALSELDNTLQYTVVHMGFDMTPIRPKLSVTRQTNLGTGSFGSVYRANLINTTTNAEMIVAVKYMNAENFSIFELVGLNIFGYFIGVYVRNETNENDYNSRDKDQTRQHTDSGFTFLCSVYEIQNIQNTYPDCEICIVMTLFSCSAMELPDNIMCDVNVIDSLIQLVEQLQLLHTRGFQHNDLREDNVFIVLSQSGLISFHLADFGCVYMSECDTNAKLSYCVLTPDYDGMCDLIGFFLNKKCMEIPKHIRKDLSLIAEHLIDEDYPGENPSMPKTFKEFYQWLLEHKQN